MTSSQEDPSGMSQLQALVDLLIELQAPNLPQEACEESLPSQEDSTSTDKSLSLQSVDEVQNSSTYKPIVEPELNLPKVPQFNEEQAEVISEESISLSEDLASDNCLSVFDDLQNLLLQPQPSVESHNLSSITEPDVHQAENSATVIPMADDSLVPFGPQSSPPLESINLSTESIDDTELDDSIEALENLRSLLLTPELLDSRQLFLELREKLEHLNEQINQPKMLINLLLPLMTELLSIKISQAKREVAEAIAPILDEAIQAKAKEDKAGISAALAPLLAGAVTQQVDHYPGEMAKALGPEMGTAIKEQISLERDAMVDALYPVIGSTIAKYMTEVIDSINQKLENALSLEGVSRKIRAKIQGVSEAELIFREAVPFTIQGIFLIHKASGLVIYEVQPAENERLDSDMIAGMLTAIRSFVNDFIAQSGDVSEIDQIEYGTSRIALEVAGYCYLAVISKGQPPQDFLKKMRENLGIIVQKHGEPIELFDGNSANVPVQVKQLLTSLIQFSETSIKSQKPKFPIVLLLLIGALLGAIFIPWGIHRHRSGISHRLEENTSLALSSDPELAVYLLNVEADPKTIKLAGKLPNEYLRLKAEAIANRVEPNLKVENDIIAVKVPPDPVLAAAEVKRVANILNQVRGVDISASYLDRKVRVEGIVTEFTEAQKITQAFEQIPGVESVTNTEQLLLNSIVSRIYFEQNLAVLMSAERQKVIKLKDFLELYPNKHLKLIGYSSREGSEVTNQRLAQQRAEAVKDVLVAQGIDSGRLSIAEIKDFPRGIDAEQPLWLSRCVEFEIITP
ncbi:OmpA family protein [Lyngbya aestuarii]|uniref:OmpA family protein n=1 Tax=Lyngbya aestuarii TaxID=118322 RepID=UPI00403D97B1